MILLLSCSGQKSPPTSLQEIETGTVTRDSIERSVLFTGSIDAESAAQVYPRATGKISKKVKKEGDEVKKGQAIMYVDRDEVGYTFTPMPVVSPIDGLVGTISVDVGDNVGPNTPAALVVKPGQMRVKLDVPEKYLNAILPGTKVSMTVDTLGDKNFEGIITTSSPAVNPKTRTARIEVGVQNSDGLLKHGMFGKMKLVIEQYDNVLVAPYNSISWEGDKQFVYKVVDNKVNRLEIKTGLRNDTHVEVLEGVSEQDVLAIGNLLNLKDGEAVKIKP